MSAESPFDRPHGRHGLYLAEYPDAYDKLLAENERLNRAIKAAPHTANCSRMQRLHGDGCNCWKATALMPSKRSSVEANDDN